MGGADEGFPSSHVEKESRHGNRLREESGTSRVLIK